MGKHIFTSDQKLKWWGNGEWVEEIDSDEWEYKGIKCHILRVAIPDGPNGHIFGGYFCGYIKVPDNHLWFKKEDIHAEVHGGITFAKEKDKKEWWIGFDAAHSNDIVPSTQKTMGKIKTETAELMSKHMNIPIEQALESAILNSTYRNFSYMKDQCERLVDQMLEVKSLQPKEPQVLE